MKRAIKFTAIVAFALMLCFAGCSRSSELVSTVTEELSSAFENIKGLLPASDDGEGQTDASEDGEDQAGVPEWLDGLSLPSLESISLGQSILSSAADVALMPTDDYGQNYVFTYDGEDFSAYYSGYSWTVYDSYKITNHDDIVIICQALQDEHPVYGSDWESLRTAEDMAFEWEQHNIAYRVLPEDSHWRDDAKDVDLDPDDQGKTLEELYESRTGEKFDIRKYLS